MKRLEEILKQLPSSWDEITLEQFQKLTSVVIAEDPTIPFTGIDNTLGVISQLTGLSVDELENLPMIDLQRLAAKMSFITSAPSPAKKSFLEWKKLEDITYNDFVTALQMQQDQFNNLHKYVKMFTTNKLTEEEVLQLPITEVHTGFFLFRKELKKYLKCSIRSQKVQVARLLFKQKLKDWRKKVWK